MAQEGSNGTANTELDSSGLCRRCGYRRSGLFLANAWRAGALLLLAGVPCFFAWMQVKAPTWTLPQTWVEVYGIVALGNIALAFGVKPVLSNIGGRPPT